MLSEDDKKELTELWKWLPRGWSLHLVKETGLSTVMISRIKNFQSRNDTVLEKLIDLALYHKDCHHQVMNKVRGKIAGV